MNMICGSAFHLHFDHQTAPYPYCQTILMDCASLHPSLHSTPLPSSNPTRAAMPSSSLPNCCGARSEQSKSSGGLLTSIPTNLTSILLVPSLYSRRFVTSQPFG